MDDQKLLERISAQATGMAGKPVIKGTQLTVDSILNLLAHGQTHAEIISEYKGLSEDDIKACLMFAAKALEDVSYVPLAGEMSGYDQAIQEVRGWKAEVSARIRKLGFAEFHRQSAEENSEFIAQIEAARQAKLAKDLSKE